MKTIRLLSLTILSACAAALPAFGQGTGAGKVDLTFNPNTTLLAGFPNNQVNDAVGLATGQVLVAGAFTQPPSFARRGLVRLNTDGSRDTNFVAFANSSVSRLLPTSDGRFYVFGPFTGMNGVSRVNYALIDANGNLDPGFVTSGLGAPSPASRMAVGPDNKLLVNTASNLLVRVGINGVVESSTNVTSLSIISMVAIHTNGQIYVIGYTSGFPSSQIIVGLNPDGSTNTGFASPTFTNSIPFGQVFFTALALQPDGKILISGGFTQVNGLPRVGIVRLNLDGTVDTTFVPGPGGIGTTVPGGLVEFGNIAVSPDGKIVVGRDGPFRYSGVFKTGIARITSTGALDTGFDPGAGPTGIPGGGLSGAGFGILCVAVGPTGDIYAGGNFTNFNGTKKQYIVRLNKGPISGPNIVTPPQSQSVSNGVDVTFTVVASGPGPLTYVWKHNTKIIPGATNATLTVTNVQLADVGAYLVTVFNPAGNATAAPAVLTVNGVSVPDLTGPTFTIRSPAGTFVRSTTNQYTFSGTSKDNLGLASLSYMQDTNPWVQIPLQTNWNFTVTLQPGTNRFRLFVTDIANNNSATQNFVAFYVVTQTLSLTINGKGTVTGATNGQGFEIGRSYPFKATPMPGNLFSNWIADGVIVTNPAFSFFMWSNSAVTANFVTNPFIALKGAYYGLFYQTNDPAWDSSGFFTLMLAVNGTYSGKLQLGPSSHPFTGGFDLMLASTKRILRPAKSDLVLALQLTDGSDQINGSVSNVNFFSELGGYRAPFSTTQPASNYVGKYNLLLSGGTNPTTSPFGHGFAKIGVASGGATTIAATLADGTTAMQSVPLGGGGIIPLYMVLYTGKGSIFGWLTLNDTDTNDISGPLLWTKTNVTTGAFYRGGFTNGVETIGSRYVSTNKPILNFSNAVVLIEGANLAARTTNDVILGALNKITVTPTISNKLVLTLNVALGQVTGTFLNQTTGKSSPIKSVILQDQNSVVGFALGTNQSGFFYFGLPENFPLFPLSP